MSCVTKAARAAIGLVEFIYLFPLHLNHRHENQLRDAHPRFNVELLVRTVPAGNINLALVVGVDQHSGQVLGTQPLG